MPHWTQVPVRVWFLILFPNWLLSLRAVPDKTTANYNKQLFDLKKAVFGDVAPCRCCINRRYYETYVNTIFTQRHIPEDGFLHSHRRGNLKSYNHLIYICLKYLRISDNIVEASFLYKYYVSGHYPSPCSCLKHRPVLLKTECFGDRIMPPSSGENYSVGRHR
jgi:hypothetical protein